MTNAPSMDMTAMRDAVANGSVTAESICATMMAGARTHNPQLNAYHEVFEEQAMEAARKVDADASAGRPLPPLALGRLEEAVVVLDEELGEGKVASSGAR